MKKRVIFLMGVISVTYFIIYSYKHIEARGAERTFELTYQASIQKIPSSASRLRIWIPLAHTGEYQKILDRKIISSHPYQIFKESQYENEILHFSIEAPLPSQMDVTIAYRAVVESAKSPLRDAHFKKEIHLGSNRWMVVDASIQELAQKVTKGKELTWEQARAIYDYVITHMQYDKTTPGWGNGDTVRACLVGKGNCTDFHSLFISLARAREIPSRFKIGIPLPDLSEGKISGYHCWAEFYINGKGWISVDASEAWKHPEKLGYYFGTFDENRLHISTGRDIQLVPKQEEGPLNIFFYPYVELDGKPFQAIETEFQFKELRTKQKEA